MDNNTKGLMGKIYSVLRWVGFIVASMVFILLLDWLFAFAVINIYPLKTWVIITLFIFAWGTILSLVLPPISALMVLIISISTKPYVAGMILTGLLVVALGYECFCYERIISLIGFSTWSSIVLYLNLILFYGGLALSAFTASISFRDELE